jgi:hypothetical protein
MLAMPSATFTKFITMLQKTGRNMVPAGLYWECRKSLNEKSEMA